MKPKAEIKRVKNRRAHFPIDELRNNTPNFFGHGKTRKLAAQARHIHLDREDEEDEEKSSSWIWLAAIGGLGAAGYLWIKNYPDKAREALTSIGAMQIPGVSDLVDTIAGGKTPSTELTKQVNDGAASMTPDLAAIPKTLSPGVRDQYVDMLASDAQAKDGEFKFDSRWAPPPKLDGLNPDEAAKAWMAKRYFAAQAWALGKASGAPTDKIIRSWKADTGATGDIWNRASADKTARDIIDTAVDYHTHRKTGLPVLLHLENGEPDTEDYILLKSAQAAIIESERTGKPSNLADALKAYRVDAANKGLNPEGVLSAFVENPDHPESRDLGAKLRAGYIADVTAGMKAAAGDPLNPAHTMATEFFKMGIPETPAEIQRWGEKNPEFMDNAVAAANRVYDRVKSESGIRAQLQADHTLRAIKDHYNMVSSGIRPVAEVASSLSNFLDVPVELFLPRLGACTPAAAPFMPQDLNINRIDKKGVRIVGGDPNVINYHNHFSAIQDALHAVRGLPSQEAQVRVNSILDQKIPPGSDLYRELRDRNNFGNATQNAGLMASALMSRHGSLAGLPVMATLAGVGGAIYNRWNNPTNVDVPTSEWIKSSALNIGQQTLDISAHFGAQQLWWRGLDKATQDAVKASAPPGASPTGILNKVYQTVRHPIDATKSVAGAVLNPAATAGKTYTGALDRMKATGKVLTGDSGIGFNSAARSFRISPPGTVSSAVKLGSVLKGIRALSANTAAGAIIMEGVSSTMDIGKWAYSMLTNSSGFYDAKFAEVAQNTFANGGKGMGFWGTTLAPLQAFAVRQGKAEYINQMGDDSKMGPLGAGYKRGAEMLVDAKLMQGAIEFANGTVKDSPLFAGLPPDLRLMLASTIGDRAFNIMKQEAEPFNAGVIDIDTLDKGAGNPYDSLISRVTGASKPKGNAPPGLDASTWEQQNKSAGQLRGLFNVLGGRDLRDLARTSVAATHERVMTTVRDALDTSPLYMHLPAAYKDQLAQRAQAHWQSKTDGIVNNLESVKTHDELASVLSQASTAIAPATQQINSFSTGAGFGEKPRFDISQNSPHAIHRGVQDILGTLMDPRDTQALGSPETTKMITDSTGLTPEQIMAKARVKTTDYTDVLKPKMPQRGALRKQEIIDDLKKNGLGDLLIEYQGSDRASDKYSWGGKTYGGPGSPMNSRYGFDSTGNDSLKNQRIVLEDRREAAKAAAYQRLDIDPKDPNAESIFQAKVARLPETTAKAVLAPFTHVNAALHALNQDVRSQGGHALGGAAGFERFKDNTFVNPEAINKLLQELGEKYGFDKVEPPAVQGRYYVDAKGNSHDLAEGQEAPKGFKEQAYGFDSSKWDPQGDNAPVWTFNKTTGRIMQVSPEAIRRGYQVESPLTNPGLYLTGVSRYQTAHPEFWAAKSPETFKNMDTYWRQHQAKAGEAPDPFQPAPEYIMGADGKPTQSIGEGANARPVTREDVIAHMHENPRAYRDMFPGGFRGNSTPQAPLGDPAEQSWSSAYWDKRANGNRAQAIKDYEAYRKNLTKVEAPKAPVVSLPQEPAKVKPTEIQPVKPVVSNTPPGIGNPKKASAKVWGHGCKIAAESADGGTPLDNVVKPMKPLAEGAMDWARNMMGMQKQPTPQTPPAPPVTPASGDMAKTYTNSITTPPPSPQATPGSESNTGTPALTPHEKSDAVAKSRAAQQKSTQEPQTTATNTTVSAPTQTTPTNPDVTKPQSPSVWDQAKAKAQEGMDWAQKYNLDLAAIPVGLGLMLMGGKAGAIMGALVLGGGAYGAYQRYQSLNNAGGEIPPPKDPSLLAEIQKDPKKMDDYRAKVVSQRLGAMRAAASDEGKWQQWMQAPDNAKFFGNLKIAYDYLPSFVKSRVQAADPAFKDINDNQFEMMISGMTGGRIGKPKPNLKDSIGLASNLASSKIGM